MGLCLRSGTGQDLGSVRNLTKRHMSSTGVAASGLRVSPASRSDSIEGAGAGFGGNMMLKTTRGLSENPKPPYAPQVMRCFL